MRQVVWTVWRREKSPLLLSSEPLYPCVPIVSNTIFNNLSRSNTLSVYFLTLSLFFLVLSTLFCFFSVLFISFFIPFFLYVTSIKIRNSGVVTQASNCSSISTICENCLYVRAKSPYSFISVPNFEALSLPYFNFFKSLKYPEVSRIWV
jgi:hypothetical protein